MIIDPVNLKDCVLILDFGSQYTKLLFKLIRSLGVCCIVKSWNIAKSQFESINPRGLILSGGPESINNIHSPKLSSYIFSLNIPILGICYGMQLMAVQLGGKVQYSLSKREFGPAKVKILYDNIFTNGIYDSIDEQGNFLLDVWMSHVDMVSELPYGFSVVASTENCPIAIMINERKSLYGIQFHPEVTHTVQGKFLLRKFVIDICHCQSSWKPNLIVSNIVTNIKELVKDDRVMLAFSGGVDSSVAALLLHNAIGNRLICIFIDNGLLCSNAERDVISFLRKNHNLNIITVLAEDRFFNALIGIVDPEAKRKVIGKLFIEILKEKMKDFSNIKWLSQGTIASDIIESTIMSNNISNNIKSHHNVGGLPKKLDVKIIEPLKKFFKDEVREIGLSLGLPCDIVYQHPYPGPGLSVRILGEIKKEYCYLLRRANLIFIEELKLANLYNEISQAFVVFLPIRSIGILGDARRYSWVVSLRAIKTTDFMTAEWAKLPTDVLSKVSSRIVNEVDGISRVVYDITNKPPATIEWE